MSEVEDELAALGRFEQELATALSAVEELAHRRPCRRRENAAAWVICARCASRSGAPQCVSLGATLDVRKKPKNESIPGEVRIWQT
jgi:hypothetical protein